MAFLLRQLDDPTVSADPSWRCGRCDRCAPASAPSADVEPALVSAAVDVLRSGEVRVAPRKQWPRGLPERHVAAGRRGNIPADLRAEEGRALLFGTDPGWHEAVSAVLAGGGPVPDEVYAGVEALLARWRWEERPTWLTYVPSRRRPETVASLARRISERGRLPLREVVVRVAPTPPQETLRNSAHQAAAALDAWRVDPSADGGGLLPAGPCLLVDDETSSGWTLTVVAALLRDAGADAVLPLVLRQRP